MWIFISCSNYRHRNEIKVIRLQATAKLFLIIQSSASDWWEAISSTYPDVASHVRFQLFNNLLIFARWASDEIGVHMIDSIDSGPWAFLCLHHGLDRILHALLDQISRGHGHGRYAVITTLAILFKQVPIVKLLLKVFNFQIHDNLYRSANIL